MWEAILEDQEDQEVEVILEETMAMGVTLEEGEILEPLEEGEILEGTWGEEVTDSLGRNLMFLMEIGLKWKASSPSGRSITA